MFECNLIKFGSPIINIENVTEIINSKSLLRQLINKDKFDNGKKRHFKQRVPQSNSDEKLMDEEDLCTYYRKQCINKLHLKELKCNNLDHYIQKKFIKAPEFDYIDVPDINVSFKFMKYRGGNLLNRYLYSNYAQYVKSFYTRYSTLEAFYSLDSTESTAFHPKNHPLQKNDYLDEYDDDVDKNLCFFFEDSNYVKNPNSKPSNNQKVDFGMIKVEDFINVNNFFADVIDYSDINLLNTLKDTGKSEKFINILPYNSDQNKNVDIRANFIQFDSTIEDYHNIFFREMNEALKKPVTFISQLDGMNKLQMALNISKNSDAQEESIDFQAESNKKYIYFKNLIKNSGNMKGIINKIVNQMIYKQNGQVLHEEFLNFINF